MTATCGSCCISRIVIASTNNPIYSTTSQGNFDTINSRFISYCILYSIAIVIGIQDAVADEPGIDGIEVTLTGGGIDGVIGTGNDDTTDTTTTAGGGQYSFENLNPGEQYQVSFNAATLPAGTEFTTTNAAGSTEANDSDANANGVTPIVTLNPGENNLDIDAGVLPLASLGDTVFRDNDGDGIQDAVADEPGIDGIEVTLTGGGIDGVIGTGGDDTTAVDTTDNNGQYSFENLNPGEQYQVSFDAGDLPAGTEFTTTNAAGSTEANDSDANANGVTPIVTLTPGENNLDIDAGVLPLALVEGTASPDVLVGSPVSEIIAGYKGQDTLTGGAGNDRFIYTETSDGVDIITDFTSGEDKLVFSSIIDNELGYTGTDPIGDGFVIVENYGSAGTMIQVDFDAAGELLPKDVVFLEGVTAINNVDFAF